MRFVGTSLIIHIIICNISTAVNMHGLNYIRMNYAMFCCLLELMRQGIRWIIYGLKHSVYMYQAKIKDEGFQANDLNYYVDGWILCV